MYPACMGPEDANGICTWGKLVMYTLRQSAALEDSHRCLILPCFYEEHGYCRAAVTALNIIESQRGKKMHNDCYRS
jgi:hypothetical protein